MEIKFVFFVIAVIYWVLKSIYGNKDKSKNEIPVPANQQKKPKSARSRKSFDEIYQDFIQEVEKKNTTKKTVETTPTKVAEKKSMDWQKVSSTKIPAKEQLIKHEDYHAEHGKIEDITSINSIADSEGEVYQFDIDNVDWKQAIIAKEILDRKYA